MKYFAVVFGIVAAACEATPEIETEIDTDVAELVTGPTRVSTPGVTATLAFNWGNNLAIDGRGVVHAVWTEGNAVAYTRSANNGTTWPPPGTFGAGPLVPGAFASLGVRVAASGDDIYIAWQGVYEGFARVYLIQSHDAGATFAGPRPISDAGIGATFPSLAADGTTVAVVWSDNRRPHAEVYARVSRDRGATFAATTSVSTPDSRSSWTPSVAVQGSAVHVAWTDERHDTTDCVDRGDPVCYEEEYYRRSLDGGVTWGPEVRLTFDPGAPKSSWAPSLAVAGDLVHVAYFDFRTGVARIYYQRSLDRGATWTPTSERLISDPTDAQPSARPVLSARGTQVRMTYWREANGPADIVIAGSTNGGATWAPPGRLTANTAISATHPQIALAPNGSNHVIWMEDNQRVMYMRID